MRIARFHVGDGPTRLGRVDDGTATTIALSEVAATAPR